MASGGAEGDDGNISLDIDDVHMLLQVEHEQIQKRTFTCWMNAQLAKRCPPSCVSDLFLDLRDGSLLLDLLEVMSGQPLKRQRGRGVFQQRSNIEVALNFLKKKSIKTVNINIPDIIDGRPSIILGLVWTIILHYHIEELASALSFSSCHSSLDSLVSLDSWTSSPIPASPLPAARTSPLHRRFSISAKKALLMWVRDQCKKVHCSVNVKDFTSSWRSGEAFLAILCSLRPELVDLSQAQSRTNQENLEEAFHLAERELHIPKLLEPQDVDVKDPEEKSIMTYVAQFLQHSNDMPAPDDHLQEVPSESRVGSSSLQIVDSLTQEAFVLMRQPVEVEPVPLKVIRQKLKSLRQKMEKVDVSHCVYSPDLQTALTEKLQQTLPQLVEAQRTCGELQRAASRLEGCLTELDHWSTDAIEGYTQLKEKTHEGHTALESTARVLIYRGLQLMHQVVREWQDLQDFVAERQKTSSLQRLSTSNMQDRISAALAHSQEIQKKLSSFGFKHQVGESFKQLQKFETVSQTYRDPEMGSYVLTRTKYMDQTENVGFQGSKNERTHAVMSQPSNEPGSHIQSFSQTAKEAEFEPFFKTQAQAASFSQSQPSKTPTSSGLMLSSERPVVSPHATSSVPEEKECSSSSQGQNIEHMFRAAVHPNTPQHPAAYQPPVMISSEVHSKAQSMAKSRLEKARLRLQGRIQQAMKLFGSKELTESQFKKKQKAIKTLNPALLEEFLGAVEGLGAFCSGPELQDLMLLSDSVRKQWEDVRREMAAFVHSLKSKIKDRKQPIFILKCEMFTNTLYEAADLNDQTDPESCQQQQSVTQEDSSAEERFESLRELWETLTPRKSSSPATDQLTEETRVSEAVLPEGRRRQLEANAPLSPKDSPAEIQPGKCLTLKRSMDSKQRDVPPVDGNDNVLQDVPTENEDDLMQSKASEWEKRQQSSLQVKEQLLRARLLHIPETQTHVQAVVRRNTVESKQEAEWTVISQATVPPREESPSEQNALGKTISLEKLPDLMESSEDQRTITEKLNQIASRSLDISDLTSESTMFSDLKEVDEMLKAEMGKVTDPRRQRTEKLVFLERSKTQKLKDAQETKTGNDLAEKSGEHSTPSVSEEKIKEESSSEAKRRRRQEENETKTEREEEHKIQTRRSEGEILKTKDQLQRRSNQTEREERENLVQRRANFLASLRETKESADHLRLQEPTLPALQQRTRVLTELESHLAGLVSEVQLIRDASSRSGILDEIQIREMTDLWDETRKAVTERMEQCHVLMELLKKFQNMRSDLSGKLQRAESTISEHASYVGKDYLQRLHTKVVETKAELNGLGDDIEEIRCICRQLHSLLRQIPGFTSTPFETEADGLMDRWLDLTERTDSHLENLHLCLTLWDGVLQLGADTENWTDTKLSVFAQTPCFQNEDEIKALQNEIMIQEESVQRFHRRAAEIQSLLQTTETPLELQVVETQMRKKIEQLKELFSETEDVYKQMVATEGQIIGKMTECLNSLQNIQDSLCSLTGPDVATVLSKLKELCWELNTQDEQAQSLLEDVRVLASIAGPLGLQNLSVSRIRLEEKVQNTHQLFSEVEEQTQRNIQGLDRLQTEKEHLEKWLHAAEEKALKEEELSLLKEEALQQRVRAGLIAQIVSSLRSGNLQQLTLLDRSCKLLERFHNFHTNIRGGSEEAKDSPIRDVEEFQSLFKSTQSWIEGLRRIINSPVEPSDGRTPVEQNLHGAQVVLNVTAEAEARLEELRVRGSSLNQKHQVQETIQKAEEQWRNILQSVQPFYRALQENTELSSLYLDRRRDARHRLKELQRQTEQFPTLFSWPGSAEREQACCVARQLEEESLSLKSTLIDLDEKRMELAGETSCSIWRDSSWAELDSGWSALMEELKGLCSCLEEGLSNEQHFGQLLQDCHHNLTTLQEKMSVYQAKRETPGQLNTDVAALEVLLKDGGEIEKDLLQLAQLRDSLTVSSTADAQDRLSEQVSDLQNHKRALESSVSEQLQAAKLTGNERIQQVREEVSFMQTELGDVSENVGNLSGIHDVLPDTSQLTQQWCRVQDCDKRTTAMAARVNDLQRTRETQGTLPADVILKEHDSLRSVLLQKEQRCAETAETAGGTINELQQWSRTVQAETSSSSPVGNVHSPVQMDLSNRSDEGSLRKDDGTTADKGASNKEVDPTEQNSTNAASFMEINKEDAFMPIKAPCSENPDVLRSKTPLSQEMTLQTCLVSEEDGGKSCTGTQSSMDRTLSEHMSDSLPALHKTSLDVGTQPTISSPHNDRLPERSETLRVSPDDRELENHHKTAVLDMESQGVQQQQNAGTDSPDVLRCSQEAERCEAKLSQSKPRLFKASVSPDSGKADLNSCDVAAQSETLGASTDAQEQNKHDGEISGSPDKVFTIMLELQAWNIQQSGEIEPSRADDFRWSQGAEDSNTGHLEKKSRLSPALNSPDSRESEPREDPLSETQRDAADRKWMMAADTEQNTGTGGEEVTQSAGSDDEWRLDRAPEETLEEVQIRDVMEPERTAPGSPAGLGAAEVTSGSPESYKFTMQDVFADIQDLVEKSYIRHQPPHADLKWDMQSSPGAADIRLARTLQQVLACRFQPAQLDVTAMAKQLKEAQEYRSSVQEQVAAMKSKATMVLDPHALNTVLLDASDVVQIKAAQLDQVKQYHIQVNVTRAFLEVLQEEKEKMSSHCLDSSALQAKHFHALLQTMEQKKSTLEDLLRSSSKLSVHLSDAESSGVLPAQLRDLQEDWRFLKQSLKGTLQRLSNSSSQSSLILKEAKQLKSKLETFLDFEMDGINSLELDCLTTDLKLYNQLYLSLQSQSDALSYSLGTKEKDEIERSLQNSGSLLSASKKKLDSLTQSCGSRFLNKLNKQLRQLTIWAKQAENHSTTGQRLALFPEEARTQIAEMRTFQTDILSERIKMRLEVEEIKGEIINMEKEDDEVLKTIEDLYETIADNLDQVLDSMKKSLCEREKLLCDFTRLDTWLAETSAEKDPCFYFESVSDVSKLEDELKRQRLANVEIENQLKLLDSLSENCSTIAMELSPGENVYLTNRLSGLWTELDGLMVQGKATSWELERLIHEHTSSDEVLSTVQDSLKQISADLEQQKFLLTKETLSMITHSKHRLMVHQCQVQELQHCQEDKRNSLLCSIGELQDRCEALGLNAIQHDKYLHLRRQIEESMDSAKIQIQDAKNQALSLVERFRLCQTVLVELPLIKTQCKEAVDQLKSIAPEFHPSELKSEKEQIHHTVETLASWERSLTGDIKNLEAELQLGLQFNTELPAFRELLQRTKDSLGGVKPVRPDERAIDSELQKHLVTCRHIESGTRVLEGLAQKENLDLCDYENLYSLRDATVKECHSWMEDLSQARESLTDYQRAAQRALTFLRNAESTFLSALRGVLDCAEEQKQTQQALKALKDGLQSHICHLVDRAPQQSCLSRPESELLHINVLSQLLVGKAILEAQAQLRLECLQRCEKKQRSRRKCREDVRLQVSQFESRLSELAAEQVTSYDECVALQRRAKLLKEDLNSLTEKMEDLRVGCPVQVSGVGKDGELGGLWRRWASLRQGVGLLMARTEQREEEWKDIMRSLEQCCSHVASLQAEVPDSSTVSFSQREPHEYLVQAELHQKSLDQEQHALLSLEHQLEHVLNSSAPRDPTSPGPTGKVLVKIREDVRSLKERNVSVVAAAQAEEKERQNVQEATEKVENHLFAILLKLEVCSDPNQRQELQNDLCSLKSKLTSIMNSLQSRCAEIPADIRGQVQQVQQSLQKAEEMLLKWNNPVGKLASRVKELGSGLERVEALLEQRSPTLSEAQNVLKDVWDELDAWHSSLMLLESEVQDLAEDQPNEAQLLMDRLTEPLQLYQNAARMAEDRTTFLSNIPACLQEFEDVLHRAACWLDEAHSWLSTPSSFTTVKSLHNHAKYLQLILEDSERLMNTLQDFRSVLAEVSAVCDFSSQEEKLDQSYQEIHKMQCNIVKPLDQFLQAVAIVEGIEGNLKKMEKDALKIKTILSAMDVKNRSLMEHIHNREVILASLQSMQSSLRDMEQSKEEMHLPDGAESLQVFSRIRLLLQQLEELEQVTREQISQLERSEGAPEDLGITSVSDSPEETQHLEGPPYRHFFQEAFSEEEEDEEDESCHSSSSDTLTCSIPEDLEEMLSLSDVQSEDVDKIKTQKDLEESENVAHQFSLEAEMSSKVFGSQNTETDLLKMDLKDNICQAFSPETGTSDLLNAEGVKVPFKAAASKLESPEQETSNINPQTKSPPLEETRLIPSRPITPFSCKKASDELREEEDQHLQEVSNSLLEAAISSAGQEDDDLETQSWSRLCSQISTKLSTIRNVLEQQRMISTQDGGNNEKLHENELTSAGSASAVLQEIHESVTMLRQMGQEARSSGGSPPRVEELYEVVRRFVPCLDSLTHFLWADGGDDPQLRLLQQECVSSQLVTLTEFLGDVVSEIRPEEPDAHSCLTSLQDSLHTVQLVLKSSCDQLIQRSDLPNQHQELSSNILFLLDEFETGQDEIAALKDGPRLEGELSRHLKKRTGGKHELQNASQSLLRGVARLLELGEVCLIERRMGQAPNQSKLQAVLCRHKKLLQVLKSQLSFLQYLFQHEPDAPEGQEDEWMQLEVRAKARQQQALEQEVAFEKRLQDWIFWEDVCSRLGRVLDESEAFISSGEPEEGDDEEEMIKRRLDACKQTRLQLDESRVVLGMFLDQKKLLQAEPWFAASVCQAGGALELRWKSAYRWTEQAIQRLKDTQDGRARFQTDFASVSERLLGAKKHLKTFSGLTASSDLSHDAVQSTLVKLLDFSVELEATLTLKESVSKDGTQLLHLREADCPKLRAQLAQLEVSCSQLTSDLSKIQDHLQQCLMAAQPPMKLLSDLEDWLKKMEAQLNREREQVLKAENATQFGEILQRFQVLKTALANGQHLLDFLSQPGAQMAAADVQALSSERSVFAEKLGAVRLQWLNLQRQLQKQIHDVEHIHHTCAEREGHLQRLHGWIEEQKKLLHQWKQPTSQTLAQKTLLEWEAVICKVKEVSAALKELKTTRVQYEKREKHPSDLAFSVRAECVTQACGDLSQRMEGLRPALQQTVEEWTLFQRALGDVVQFATRVRCALQRQQAPFFSLKQAEVFSDFLQDLKVKVEAEEEQLWTAVDKSYLRLLETLHHGAAQALGEKVEKERKRWKDTVQEIKDEHVKTGQTFSLWEEYSGLSESCSRHLQLLWHEWDELSSPEKDPQAGVCSVKKLQIGAEELESNVGNVLAASKCLMGRLELLAANLIQSETRLLTRDTLLLNQAISRKMKSLEEDSEQPKQLQTLLEGLEEQMQSSLLKFKSSTCDTNSVKQVLLELSDLIPSLVDIKEMSCITLTNQEKERVQSLNRKWVENVTRASDRNRKLHKELQLSQDFQAKWKKLKSIQEKLEQESVCRKPGSYSDLREMLPVHQRLQAEIIVGHQLLEDLLCDAVKSMEKETGDKRSELAMQVACMKRSWFSSVALTEKNWTSTRRGLQKWRIYHHGLKCLRRFLQDVDSFLPPTGPTLYTLHQQQNLTHLYQCVDDSLGLYSPLYAQTVEAGKHLCETVADLDCQSRLQSDLLDLKSTWERVTVQLKTNKDLVFTTVQTWGQAQGAVTNTVSELDKVRRLFTGGPEDSEEEPLIQETELSLQRLATGLKELATMKTDLSQFVAASDSALLEQQLEQLHCQWEELCTKVSLRRQEIADRLNAWTIFNDKNKEFCDWLTQMENKVCQSGDLSIEEMVEKLKKDCMEEINLFSENKSHLKQLGEQLLLASDEAKQSQVRGSLQEVNQRWHNLFHYIEARVKKLKETLVTVQQLDKNMSNLRSWLSRIEAELSRPITYSVCHQQEIQRRLAEHQELQRDIEQHTEGVVSVLSLCDVLLRDEDAAGGFETESDSLQETSRSLDQRWRTICAMALERRLRIEETWTLWCKFLNDYSRFEDWLKLAERTAANPNSADVLFSVAKEELKKFESLQRQVHERLTQLELINNQYRRLARENRTDRASQLKAMVSEGNRRWDTLHRRVTAILRRLKYFTGQREEFEGTRENMLVWLTELDLQLTNVEHFSESDVHHKIQQLNSFQKEITLNTERIDGLIVFGEGLIQKSSPQDAALIEDELEELHSYCQEVFSRLVRFHQRLSQPPMIKEEPDFSDLTFSLESSLELIGRPWLGRSHGSLPATPIHLLSSPLERSGRETPVSVDSLPLEWDHTGDVGGSSSHEDDEEEGEDEEEGTFFSALSASSTSLSLHERPRWRSPDETDARLDSEGHTETTPTLTSTPLKEGYLRLMTQCSGSIENIKRVSLILDDEEKQEEFGLTGLNTSDKQSGVIERWELLRAQSRCSQTDGPQEPHQLISDLDDITSWLENVMPELDRLLRSDSTTSMEDMEARAKELKEMEKVFSHYKSIMLTVNLQSKDSPDLQEKLVRTNRNWSKACTGLQQWDTSLRRKLMCCQEFHESLHSLLLWLAHTESRCCSVDINRPETTVRALKRHDDTLTELQEELRGRQVQHASLQALWSQLQPEDAAEDSDEAREKLHVTGNKLKQLVRQVDQDLHALQQRHLDSAPAIRTQSASAETPQEAASSKKGSSNQREMRESSPPRSFFYRLLRAAFPLQLLLLLLLILPCLIPLSDSDHRCSVTNNFAQSFYPMLHYTNGPPPT